MTPRSYALGLSVFLLACCGCSTGSTDSAQLAGEGTMPTPAAVGAPMRLARLHALQKAPGYAFDGSSGRLAARMGALGAEARVALDGDRLEVAPPNGRFSLGVRTAYIGRAGGAGAPAMEAARAEGQELVLARGAVEERYLAGPAGLEQIYRLDARPSGAGPLAIEVAFDGLTPDLAGEAKDLVRLRDEAGVARAVYRDVSAVDAAGRELAARMVVDGHAVRLVIDDEGAAYPLVIDPLVATVQEELVPAAGGTDGYGDAVAISGDTAFVGAPREAMSGVVHVFHRAGGAWVEQTKLTGAPSELGFGGAISVSGDSALITSFNRVYVFERVGSVWSLQAILSSPDAGFGRAVAVSDGIAVVSTRLIGAPQPPSPVYVYTRGSTTWVQTAKLVEPNPNPTASSYFGQSVATSSGTVAIGSGGAAYVFTHSGSVWSQQATLSGLSSDTDFGASVAVSGDTTIVGSRLFGGSTGTAYVFVRTGNAWTQQQQLLAADAAAGDRFGAAVGLSGDMAVIGAPTMGSQPGKAYAFSRAGSTWTAAPLHVNDAGPFDAFGSAVAVSGSTLLVSSPFKYDFPTWGPAYAFVVAKGLGDPCTAGSECDTGFCVDAVCCDQACGGSATDDCVACSLAAGSTADGTCKARADGASCDDGDACTDMDACTAGVCKGTTSGQCAGACHDPTTDTDAPAGTACSDGNPCTQFDTCQAGVCVGAAPVQCPPPDACHGPGTCDATTGACSSPPKTDGTACDDGDLCTQKDECHTGVCVGGDPIVCVSPDECHEQGICDPLTGRCVKVDKPNGAACADGRCLGGKCELQTPAGASSASSGGGSSSGGCSVGGAGGGPAFALAAVAWALAALRRRGRAKLR